MRRSFLVAALCLSLAAGCASTSETDAPRPRSFADLENDPRLGEKVDRICTVRQIRGIGETTRDTVVVDAGIKERYLLHTFGGCFDLDDALSVSFDAFSSCLTRGDDLRAFDSVFGPDRRDFRAPACKIREIYEWDRDAEDGEDTEEDASET